MLFFIRSYRESTLPDVHLLPVDVVPVELEQVEGAGHPLVPVLLALQHVPVVCTAPSNLLCFLQSFGSRSMQILIDLASWIQIRIDLDLMDPDPGELKLAPKN